MNLVISDSIRQCEFYLPINKRERDLVVAALILLQEVSGNRLRFAEAVSVHEGDPE